MIAKKMAFFSHICDINDCKKKGDFFFTFSDIKNGCKKKGRFFFFTFPI
eukprot:UN18253